MKKSLFCFTILTLSVFFVSAQESKKNNKKKTEELAMPQIKLQTAMDSFSYAAGLNIAENMKAQGITELNTFFMLKAIDDVMNNNPKLISPEQANMTLQQKLQEFANKKSAAQKEKGEAFLKANKTKSGVITLPDGLQYEIIKAGEKDGVKPTVADTVEVDYVGTLIDGTEFDNSFKRGQSATFPCGGVIKGWTEILQLMTKGSHWKVYIPSELAYGERGAGGTIPPNSVLVFEITLRDIKPAVK